MNDKQIKKMVDRFLQWKLPEDFHPDAGISFKSTYNEHTKHPARYEPIGTNLFTATQAEQMIRYMLEGLSHRQADEAVKDATGTPATLVILTWILKTHNEAVRKSDGSPKQLAHINKFTIQAIQDNVHNISPRST